VAMELYTCEVEHVAGARHLTTGWNDFLRGKWKIRTTLDSIGLSPRHAYVKLWCR